MRVPVLICLALLHTVSLEVKAQAAALEEYVIRYDQKCLAAEVQACFVRLVGNAPLIVPKSGPFQLCTEPYTPVGAVCVHSEYALETQTVYGPAIMGPAKPIGVRFGAAKICRAMIDNAPPATCERKELTEAGLRNVLTSQFSLIALELQRACAAAGKKPEDCARPASALAAPILTEKK